MRKWILQTIAALAFLAGASMAQADTEKEGFDLLEKTDANFYPGEGSVDLYFTITHEDGVQNRYEIQAYKKGGKNMTVVFKLPEINKNDVGMRSGDTIYYKPAKDNKVSIMSYTSVFVESDFSWGDVMSADLAYDYKVTNIAQTNTGGGACYALALCPKKNGLYSRVCIVIDRATQRTLKRIYYTRSGDVLKTADLEYAESSGAVQSVTINMLDNYNNTKTVCVIKNFKASVLPGFLFDPANIGRIKVR